MSPLIKVCGMTEAENIRNVELQGVDMIGFIFYPKSPRCLCQMPGYLPACAKRVGVFVNESKENILMYTDRFSLDYIQLHGNEAPEYCRSLHNAGLIKDSIRTENNDSIFVIGSQVFFENIFLKILFI